MQPTSDANEGLFLAKKPLSVMLKQLIYNTVYIN